MPWDASQDERADGCARPGPSSPEASRMQHSIRFSLVMIDLHQASKFAKGSVCSGKHRAYRAIQGAGDVLERHIGKMTKHQNLPIPFRELSQRDLQRIDFFAAMQRVVRRRHVAGEFIGHLDPLAMRFNHGGLSRVAGAAAAVVADEVDQNTKEPGFELALVIVFAEALDDAEESFLHEVLREFGIAGRAEGVAKEPLPIGIDQGIPGGFIAGLASGKEFRDGPCVHGTLRETFASGELLPRR